MKFVQKDLGDAAETSSGGGDKGMLKEVVTLAILVALTLTIIYFLVVGITEVVVSGVSPQREQELFGGANSELVKGSKIPDSQKEKFAKCEAVLEKLRSYEEVPQIEYRLFYMEDLSPNAFAVPGGSIGVTRGLLNALDEEIAIAFVLAHELGHFAQRDHLRGLGRKLGFGIGVQLIFGADLQSFTRGPTELMLAKYSRGQESGADEFGLRCVLAVYGETEGAEALFEILEEKGAMPSWAYMFSSHPDNKSRIRRILEAKTEE
ncbi:MAG: M48 family metallopeptidase [Verrucomicrobiota bacterium]